MNLHSFPRARHSGRFLVFAASLSGLLWGSMSLVSGASLPYPDRVRQRVDVSPRFERTGGEVAALAVDADNRTYATGTFSSIGSDVRVGILRYLSDGTIDPNYRPAPLIGGTGRLLLLLPDGRLIVAGTFSHVGGFARDGIVRLLADGSVDPSFDPGPDLGLEPTALAVGPGGSIYLAGSLKTYVDSAYDIDHRVVRIASDGSRDAAFDAGTDHFFDAITALAVAPDGSVYSNGSYLNGVPPGSPSYSVALAHLLADGTRDATFNPPMSGTATTILRLDDGHLIVGGLLYDSSTNARLPGLMRLNADGSRDNTFQAAGFDFGDDLFYQQTVNPVVRQNDNKLVVTAVKTWSSQNATTTLFRFFRLESDGALDASFSTPADRPSAMVQLSDGRLIVAKHEASPAGAPGGPVLRLFADGTIDDTFMTLALRQRGTVKAVVPTVDGRWVIGGDFDSVDGQPRRGIARFNANFSRDDTFNPAKQEGPVNAVAALPDGRILVNEHGTQIIGVPIIGPVAYADGRVARIGADGVMDSGYGSWLRSTVQSILVGPNGEVLVGVEMVSPFATGNGAIARLNAQGSVESSFGETLLGQGAASWSLAGLLDGGFLTVFRRSSYQEPLKVHRYSATGTRDTAFLEDVLPTGTAGTLVALPEGRVLFGWSTESDAASDPLSARHLARLNADGTRDATFNVGLGLTRRHHRAVAVRALLLQENGLVLVAGNFDTYNTGASPGLVRLNPDGTPDAAFAIDGVVAAGFTGIHDLEFTANRSLVAGGEWNYFSDTGTLGMGLVLLQPATHPRILQQPAEQTATAGSPLTLRVEADSAAALTYQWQQLLSDSAPLGATPAAETWIDIIGATSASYTIPSAQSFQGGMYRAIVTSDGVATPTDPVTVTVNAAPPSDARLLNLSTRGLAQSGDNVLIPGFVVSGSTDKRLLIRAVGPTLALDPIGLAGALVADPQVTLKRLDTAVTPNVYIDVATNDDWGTNPNAADITTTAAQLFAFELKDTKEAALLMNLAPGQYTVVAGDKSGASGLAIVELYDADPADAGPASTLVNISNRGYAGVGDQVMIPGFVVSPEGAKTLLVRVVGPTLANDPYNVPGTMTDPQLTIYSGQTAILANDNWGDNPDAANTAAVAQQVGAFPLASGSADAAFVVTLQPGVYTVVGSSAQSGGTGVVLVEVYVVP